MIQHYRIIRSSKKSLFEKYGGVKLKIAVLTGGGHVSGLNAGIEGITEKAHENDWEVLGAKYGWEGLEKANFVELTEKNTKSIKEHGGSILGSGRWKPDIDNVMETIRENDIDGVVALGGDDTLGVLSELYEKHDFPTAGWPKTMDNDLNGTHFCVGYPKAVKESARTAINAVDVAATHRRISLISVFGRGTDWVAAGGAAYGNADMVVPGEETTELDEIYEKAKNAYYENKEKYGRPFAVVIVAEGASIEGLDTHVKQDDLNVDDFGHPKLDPHSLVSGLSDALRTMSKEKEGSIIKTAPSSMTYELRNGKPEDIDKEFGFKCGQKCVEILEEDGGKMASIKVDDGNCYVGTENLVEGAQVKEVKGTGYLDYDNFEVTDDFVEYAEPFLGKPEERIVKTV